MCETIDGRTKICDPALETIFLIHTKVWTCLYIPFGKLGTIQPMRPLNEWALVKGEIYIKI
jgi:hypothetical protein